MQFIDTHTHLYSEEYGNETLMMINNAINSGVSRLFVPSIDSSYTAKMYDLQAQFPDNVFLMMGLHPTYVKENYRDELQHVAKQLAEKKFYAVGEIGIDLYWDKTNLKQQQEAFFTQIQWAKQYKLPINIHCRDAFDEVFEILESERGPDLFGIFHCFTGNLAQAERAVNLNLKLGIGGVVTYKNGKIDQFLNKIAIENIVLETDSPYLTPVPHRGKRNESAYIIHIANKLSEIYNMPLNDVATITTNNAISIFGI